MSRFTRERADNALEAFKEIMEAFPKRKGAEFFGHFNEVALFLEAARAATPEKPEGESEAS